MKSAEQWSVEQSERFSEHDSTVRGHVRYEVTRHNLQTTLADFLQQPRRAIDVGGGKGGDAIWLANLSPRHYVTLVEPDEKYIAIAKATSGTDLDEIIQGDVQTALKRYGLNHFELLLSHGVIQYLPEPRQELKHLAALLQPGGYLSLLTACMFGKIKRFEREENQSALKNLLLTGKYTNKVEAQAIAYTPLETEKILSSAGFETIDWFGVRVSYDDDDRKVTEVPRFHLNRALRAEIEASCDPVSKSEGQMLHFIAKKT